MGTRGTLLAKVDVRYLARQRLEALGVPEAQDLDVIPDFPGSTAAAEQLRSSGAWQKAATILCTPDAAVNGVRHRALEDGKHLLQVVPAMAAASWVLDIGPVAPEARSAVATDLSALLAHGRPLPLDEVPHLDLMVLGSLAAAPDGARVGKGRGYVDIEHGILFERGCISAATAMCTLLHDATVFPVAVIAQDEHDVPVDLVATPTRVFACRYEPGFEPGIRRSEAWRSNRATGIVGLAAFLGNDPAGNAPS